MDEEAKYKEELKAAGVDIPEEVTEEKSEDTEAKDEKSEDAKTEPLQTKPEEQRKRSIYDEYKDKKAELKSEKELREQAEQERDELQRRIDASSAAPEHKQESTEEDAVAYAKKVGADPDLVTRIIEEARKGFKVETDESLKNDLAEFKTWKAQNSKTIETQMFNDEFEKTIPALKELFPKVSDDELKAIKGELDAISHTKEWHDKSLDYVAFKHKNSLSALISPKKRGMETKERKDIDQSSYDFDPNADYSKMSLKEREVWETNYHKLMEKEGLMVDAQGRKTF